MADRRSGGARRRLDRGAEGGGTHLETRAGSRRARRRAAAAGLALALAAGYALSACQDHCDAGQCTVDSRIRMLDELCDQVLTTGAPACELSGDARETTGITADTVGYRLGPGGGTLAIRLNAIDGTGYSSGSFDIEVLVGASDEDRAGRLTATLDWGSCDAGCVSSVPGYEVELDHDYEWEPVVRGASPPGGGVSDDAVLILSGVGIDIADVHTVSRYLQGGCSIAGAGLGHPR